MNNKFVILLIVAVAGALVYFKVSEPKAPASSPAQQAASKTDNANNDSGQQALPEEAKNITTEIRKDKDEDDASREMAIQEMMLAEASKVEEKRIENQQRALAFMSENPAQDIPMEFGTSGNSLKWPCKKASFAEIVDSYTKVWGKRSVEPHDTSWYYAIANGVSDYALCRAVTLGNPKVCVGLDLFKEENEFPDVMDECEDSANLLNVYLYALDKASRSDCEKFPVKSPKSSLCSEVKRYRGVKLCEAMGFSKNSKDANYCLEYFPESTADCSKLKGYEAKACVNYFQLFTALRTNNPNVCPTSGRQSVVCMAYFAKNTKNFCQQFMNNLSNNFCSGGKYLSTRRPKL